jgi:CelD/BcsL family acetyltransferase involved in cellulose biosynthesis
MPAEIGGRANPLMTRFGITPARRSGNVLVVPDTVEAYIRARGKKYRKEVERCTRVWAREGMPRFYRATTPEEIARVYSVLEEQQAARQAALGTKRVLDGPAYRAFYERLAMDGSEADLAALFALESNGEIVATLFGIVYDGTFTLLRISTGGESCSHFSPGRLVVIEALTYFVERGIRRFDLGIGGNAFQRGFGTQEVPLYDLIVARDLVAQPRAIFHRFKGRMRKNKHARAVFRHFAGMLRR